MSVSTESNFASAIQAHLDLKQRNADLGDDMPIDRYEVEDPFENHPLFKSEEQARLEETFESAVNELTAEARDAVEGQLAGDARVAHEAVLSPSPSPSPLPWPGEESTEGPALADGLWNKSRDFDWGD